MKRIQVEEIWINSNSSSSSGVDQFYRTQWEHIEDSYLLDCVTIYIKTIEENNETQDNYRGVYAG